MKNPERFICKNNKRVIFLRTARYMGEMPSVFGWETRLILPAYVSVYKCNECGNKFQGRQGR